MGGKVSTVLSHPPLLLLILLRSASNAFPHTLHNCSAVISLKLKETAPCTDCKFYTIILHSAAPTACDCNGLSENFNDNILYQVIALSMVATLKNTIKIKVKIKAKNL